MPKIRPVCGVILALMIAVFCFNPQVRTLLSLPEYQQMVVGESSHIDLDLPQQLENRLVMQVTKPTHSVFSNPVDPAVTINRDAKGYEIVALKPGQTSVQFTLLGYIPVKSIAVKTLPPRRLVVGGHSIGVMLQSRGIMVVGFAPITKENGTKEYPARDSGVQIGDLIMQVNGKRVTSENDLARLVDNTGDGQLVLNIKRQDRFLTRSIKAIPCQETGRRRIGLFVRDGIAGVGTLTFWDPESKEYGALGHIILDADTRQGVEVLKGKIVSASVQTLKMGSPGQPGEKIGVFNNSGQVAGNISRNTGYGIFGTTSVDITNPLNDYPLEVGYAHQVKTGHAEIYTVINGDQIEKFSVVIEKVYPQRQNGKGMVIKVDDPRLLSLTGGIIQGMSGSPIVQNNRIIGAVTHVFLNDPQHGYGIFMDNMLSEIEQNKISSKIFSTKNPVTGINKLAFKLNSDYK
ncbi:MAG: SpoIVB peptidase [Syntrophomonadaceae bacterium]|nr:SpoIVB peptidase [Syntrophomonadaceae bacterium]